jgi:hypothetical protein
MKKYLIVLSLILVFSCSKKHQPQTAVVKSENSVAKKKAALHGPLPKTLTVSDKVATRDVDGRLYYDVEGHRYWKNYVDGKYYMFNKGMYDNPAFKPR